MSLPALAVEKRTFVYVAIFLLTVAGIGAFFQLGQLEDPAFTVKTAVVTTFYPGASPTEVELEVTDVIEQAIQKMPELDYLHSLSRAGVSIIKVEIKQEYWGDVLPQLWDVLRKRIRDVRHELPQGASDPLVSDDFSEVYGFVLAVTGDGYDMLQLDTFVDIMRKELSLVEGVSRCDIWGKPTRAIYVDISESQLAQLGMTSESLDSQLRQQNLVVDAGSIDIESRRLRVDVTGGFQRPEDIEDLVLRSTPLDSLYTGQAPTSDIIRLGDLATVTPDYKRPVNWWMRHNGREPALAIHISAQAGVNAVKVGDAIDHRLNELLAEIPVGVEVEKIAWQGDLVNDSIISFMINLLEAIGIVLLVLCVSMGLRMAVIVGVGGLVLTIIATFAVMAVWGIDLHRMSLGALIIAMGMMVDNAIVVADGVAVRIQSGMDRKQAAIEAASKPAIPLLGATVIAIMAFYPIYAARSDTGEYCRALFQVVAASLLLSWLFAMTIVPLLCMAMLPEPKGDAAADPYAGRFFRTFRRLLGTAVRFKWPVVAVMVALLLAAVWGFGFVNQMFFPDSSRPQFMVDYWAPQGTRIERVSEDVRVIEEKLLEHPLVQSVSTFIGQGPPRFYLPVDPEVPYPEYAQLIVNVENYKDGFAVAAEIEPWLRANVSALTRVRKYGVGPSDTWKLEVKISGPGDADLGTLRRLADQGVEILEACPLAREVRTNMRQRAPRIVARFNQERGRWSLVSRDDVGKSTKTSFDGRSVGLYREGDNLYEIILRRTDREEVAGSLETLSVLPMLSTEPVPLAQVIDGVELSWENAIIRRWDRRRSVRIQCSPIDGVTFPKLRSEVVEQVESIELPPGYSLEWRGESDSTATAQASLVPGAIPTGLIVVLTLVALFNALRPPLVIFCTIPFAMIGVSMGFLLTRGSFGFLALLGLMSLAGMMIKNAIVLIDEINANLAKGQSPYDSVMDAAVSRLRPVFNAAATTVLGVIPLLQDPFWVAMAITIMFGLAFGTILTLTLLPVLYSCFYGIKPTPASNG